VLAHLETLLPALPACPLIRQPRNHSHRHADTEQQEHGQGSIEREPALLAKALEAGVAHVAWHRHILGKRLAGLVLAGPGLDCVDLRGIVVDDLGPDEGDERQEEGGEDSGEREKGTESVLLAEGKLMLVNIFTLLSLWV
jgi:hypothetical protein